MDGTGIEIMPVGNLSAWAIVAAANGLHYKTFFHASQELISSLSSNEYEVDQLFQHIPITGRAFPEQTEQDLAKARKFVDGIRDPSLKILLTLACVSVLEEVSCTRKDGQFLRWDPRSGRNVSKRWPRRICLRSPRLSSGAAAEVRRICSRVYRWVQPHRTQKTSRREF